jgi:hypothetical protein
VAGPPPPPPTQSRGGPAAAPSRPLHWPGRLASAAQPSPTRPPRAQRADGYTAAVALVGPPVIPHPQKPPPCSPLPPPRRVIPLSPLHDALAARNRRVILACGEPLSLLFPCPSLLLPWPSATPSLSLALTPARPGHGARPTPEARGLGPRPRQLAQPGPGADAPGAALRSPRMALLPRLDVACAMPPARPAQRGSSCPRGAAMAPGAVRVAPARRGRGALASSPPRRGPAMAARPRRSAPARRGPAACSRRARDSSLARLIRDASMRPCAR